MKETTKRRLGRVLLALVCFVAGGLLTLVLVTQSMGLEGRTLLQAYTLIRTAFVGDYDPETHLETTLNAMVDGLGDRWSYYLTPQEAQQVKETRANTYVGIGITVLQSGGEEEAGLEILRVQAGSPAQDAGLQAGEIIRKVGDLTVTPETRDDAIAAIQGEAGTTLTLEVQGTDGTVRTVEVTRQALHGITAAWTMTEDQVGLVTIANFYSGTAQLVEQGVAELQAQGAKALIFDLRNNPGGYVTELTDLLDYLLPEGDIFISRSYDGTQEVYTSGPEQVDLPMAVLVNGESYSAAEFFAAQLRESVGALVVGEQTSGKGYSQVLYDLPDGSAVGLSTARYYTGSGQSLIGTGVTPDTEVTLTQEEAAQLLAGGLSLADDPQFQAAWTALTTS